MTEVAAGLCQGMLAHGHPPDKILPMITERHAGLVDRIAINFNYTATEQRAELENELA